MTVFPTIAAMLSSMLITEREIIRLSNPWLNCFEQEKFAKNSSVCILLLRHSEPPMCPTLSVFLNIISPTNVIKTV